MLAGLAPTSNKERLVREQEESFVRPFRRVLADGFLLLVGASPSRIENILKITKLEYIHVVFELAPSMTFESIYFVSRRSRQRTLQSTFHPNLKFSHI